MNLYEALFSHLSQDSALTALVGENLFPLMIPEGRSAPAVTYQRISADRQPGTCGTANLVRTEVLINSYAVSTLAASAIGEAVRLALVDFKGLMGDLPISAIYLETEVDLIDLEPGLFQVSQTYSIWHEG